MTKKEETGWAWFATTAQDADTPPFGDDAYGKCRDETAKAFARCLSTPDGEKVMAHLSAVTLDRALSPLAADSVLRHLEGQRQLVAHIKALMRRGRGL
ncbi:hypothetical protein EDD55_107102 [Varunaivibrio sulfuroxidans]|uniref:Bbp19-like phage domain-containing protein n=1 Tax=Varunaivibrio sulfuroxidans TaxID=1773489 RepID=A0A4R3J9Q6_9PROT|nr:hypothetical protein [Varunaivibrio sulfuroxidans]TCS61693.1 hypothetical protein EDD55_107102 [Varunaivibrio sulfuroxidans]WES32123.1 hypothetical protein P3M64_07130 [Varunaivibrio sulfuroxidans]